MKTVSVWESRPEEKGIKTYRMHDQSFPLLLDPFSGEQYPHSPHRGNLDLKKKGLRPGYWLFSPSDDCGNLDLKKKGLRPSNIPA